MTIPINNISFKDLENEFGSNYVWGGFPISLSSYYAGGGTGLVTNPAPKSGAQIGIIPTSGQISLGNFRGVTKFSTINITPPAQMDMYGHANGPFNFQYSGSYSATNLHFILTATGGRPEQESSASYTWSVDTVGNVSTPYTYGIVQPQQFAYQGSELVIPQNTPNNSIMDFYVTGDSSGNLSKFQVSVSDGIYSRTIIIEVGLYW